MNKIEILQKQKETEASLHVTIALQQLGVTSAELTYAKAAQVFGAWFKDAVASGRIVPVRYGGGKGRTRYFSVPKILSLKAIEYDNLVNLSE